MKIAFTRAGTFSCIALLAALGAAKTQAGFPANNGSTNIVNIAAPTHEGVEAVADEVLIVFKNGAAPEQVADALDRIHGQVKQTKHSANKSANGFPDFHKVSTALPVMEAVKALANHPAIEVVEPNFIYRKQVIADGAVVNDFYYADQDPHATQFRLWGVEGSGSSGSITSLTWPYNNAFGSQADEAWASSGALTPATVCVGIIDEGVCFRHPDLIHNAWFNPNETGIDSVTGLDRAINQVDDDPIASGETAADQLNHKRDDVNGWNFFEDNNIVYYDAPAGQPDADQHGTHVAGTIGAEANNGIGVAGIAGLPGTVKMISGKFLGPNGGDTADAVDAINYFTHLKHFHGVPIKALNNSWGGGGYSSLLHAAIIDAANEDILFIAAAGNGNQIGIGQDNDRTPSYPSSYDTTQAVTINGVTHEAGYDSVIAVAAIDKTGAKAGFSNYGAKSVDIAAPGVDILSTYPWNVNEPHSKPEPGAATLMDDDNAREWCYQPMSGTSMATPHVTGAAALYASHYPQASAAAIKKALLDTAVFNKNMNGKCVSNGDLNLARMGETPAEPATKPTAFKVGQNLDTSKTPATVVKGTALITFNDSRYETSYELQRATSSAFTKGLTTITLPAENVNASVAYVDGKASKLSSGTTYYYRLRALNNTVSNGNSVYTATVSFRAP